jgi:hypothetical protein
LFGIPESRAFDAFKGFSPERQPALLFQEGRNLWTRRLPMPAKISTKTKRVVVEVFGDIPVDSENLDFLYRRRHCATVRNRGCRDLRYVAEYYELESAILTVLNRIHERDGARISKEVADRLVESVGACR